MPRTSDTACGRWPVGVRRVLVGLVVALTVAGTARLSTADSLASTATRIESDKLLEEPEGFSFPTPYTILPYRPVVDAVSYMTPESIMGESHSPYTRTTPKWSHWGPLLVLPDGRVLSSIGDHGGIDGNSYLYEYDPQTRVLRPVGDLLSVVEDWEQGEFGFGKIHGRLSLGDDGNVYFTSYWGQEQGDNEVFEGDRLFMYNPENERITDLGMPAEGWGYPSTHMAPGHGLFYAEAVWRTDYQGENKGRRFFVYDLETESIRFMGGHEDSDYGRDFFVDSEGNAYFNGGNRTLVKYDASSNQLIDRGPIMPISRIRRTAGPDPDGVMYATSRDTDDTGQHVLFSFDPATGETETITHVPHDTPAMAIDAAGEYAYMAPRYRDDGTGRPLIRTSLEDGSIQVVAFLEAAVIEALDLERFPHTSYSLAVDGDAVYVQFGIAHEMVLLRVVPGRPD